MRHHSTMDAGPDQLTVRHAHVGDDAALERLAQLDSGPVPARPALLAESRGRLLAALPLAGGPAVADPFEPTAELVALLMLRRVQLAPAENRRPRAVAARLRSALRLSARAA